MSTAPGALCSQGRTTAARLACCGARRARADLRCPRGPLARLTALLQGRPWPLDSCTLAAHGQRLRRASNTRRHGSFVLTPEGRGHMPPRGAHRTPESASPLGRHLCSVFLTLRPQRGARLPEQ